MTTFPYIHLQSGDSLSAPPPRGPPLHRRLAPGGRGTGAGAEAGWGREPERSQDEEPRHLSAAARQLPNRAECVPRRSARVAVFRPATSSFFFSSSDPACRRSMTELSSNGCCLQTAAEWSDGCWVERRLSIRTAVDCWVLSVEYCAVSSICPR